MDSFITAVDSHHAKKGILIYTDKFSSIAAKVSTVSVALSHRPCKRCSLSTRWSISKKEICS